MAYFVKIQSSDGTSTLERRDRRMVDVTLDVGRTLAVTILGVALIIAAAVLWLNGQPAPGAAVFAVGEAVIVGGLGLAVGEKAGATAALRE